MSVSEETLEYKDLSKPGEHDDKRLSNRPPGDVEVESLGHIATLRLVLAIDRLIVNYLYTNTPTTDCVQ